MRTHVEYEIEIGHQKFITSPGRKRSRIIKRTRASPSHSQSLFITAAAFKRTHIFESCAFERKMLQLLFAFALTI